MTRPSPQAPADWLSFLHEAADRADDISRRFFLVKGLRIRAKADGSPVSEADEAIEGTVRALARNHHRELALLGEEQGEERGAARDRLIIDPIDGTRNFTRGIPVFATLLAIESNGEVVAGVVSAPALGARWHAARANGAFRDGARLAVSGVATLDRAFLLHGNLAPGEAGPPPGIERLIGSVERTRGFGDFYQHMLVAEGAGEIAVDPVMKPWDIAALQVIVEEAGGQATGLDGKRSIHATSLITSNRLLHTAALETLNG